MMLVVAVVAAWAVVVLAMFPRGHESSAATPRRDRGSPTLRQPSHPVPALV